jgi:hypothetical protein
MSTHEDREWDAYLDRMTPPDEPELHEPEDEECPSCGGEGVVFGPTPGGWGSPKEYRCEDCAPQAEEP